jgi:hypothetical protein
MNETIIVEDLLWQPAASHDRWTVPHRAGGVTVLLPDARSHGLIHAATDDRWRAFGSKAIRITMTVHGPATRLDVRDLMELFAGQCGGGGWRWNRGGTLGGLEFSLNGDSRLPLLQAMPHTCGAPAGAPCVVAWGGHGRIVCTAPAGVAPVTFTNVMGAAA